MNISGSVTQWAEQFIQTVETRRQEAAGEIEPAEKSEREAAIETALLSGAGSKNHLARLMFGGDAQLGQWRSQGLEVGNEALSAAEATLKQALAEHEANGSVPSEALFNAYQLIADNQEVPAWFDEEKQQALAEMTNEEARAAFENGELYFLQQAQQSDNKAVNAYQAMQNRPSIIDQLFG